jgi:hypothetical protein
MNNHKIFSIRIFIQLLPKSILLRYLQLLLIWTIYLDMQSSPVFQIPEKSLYFSGFIEKLYVSIDINNFTNSKNSLLLSSIVASFFFIDAYWLGGTITFIIFLVLTQNMFVND